MMFHSRTARTTILATGSALALMTAALGDHAHAEGNLDASYTISFARIRVGNITATVVFGDSEYAISARGRAGGVMKVLVDGEGSFTTRGTIKDGHPVPTNFTSKIVSDAETSDVTMVLDEGGVKELSAAPPPSWDRVPATEANRQGIVDPLTAMLFSAAVTGEGLSHCLKIISCAIFAKEKQPRRSGAGGRRTTEAWRARLPSGTPPRKKISGTSPPSLLAIHPSFDNA
jgi:hypothetical protein